MHSCQQYTSRQFQVSAHRSWQVIKGVLCNFCNKQSSFKLNFSDSSCFFASFAKNRLCAIWSRENCRCYVLLLHRYSYTICLAHPSWLVWRPELGFSHLLKYSSYNYYLFPKCAVFLFTEVTSFFYSVHDLKQHSISCCLKLHVISMYFNE